MNIEERHIPYLNKKIGEFMNDSESIEYHNDYKSLFDVLNKIENLGYFIDIKNNFFRKITTILPNIITIPTIDNSFGIICEENNWLDSIYKSIIKFIGFSFYIRPEYQNSKILFDQILFNHNFQKEIKSLDQFVLENYNYEKIKDYFLNPPGPIPYKLEKLLYELDKTIESIIYYSINDKDKIKKATYYLSDMYFAEDEQDLLNNYNKLEKLLNN